MNTAISLPALDRLRGSADVGREEVRNAAQHILTCCNPRAESELRLRGQRRLDSMREMRNTQTRQRAIEKP
jgi:hypothetical protein